MASSTTPKSTPKGETVAAAKDPAAPQSIPAAVEFEPPLACVRRILKTTLPASTNVGKDASAAFARSAGIFIIYLTACANDFARENRRQTITANDVLAAVKVSYYYCSVQVQAVYPIMYCGLWSIYPDLPLLM
jgi:histone H3/H4